MADFMFYDSGVLTPFHIAQKKGQLAEYFEHIAQSTTNRLRIGVSGPRISQELDDLDPVIGTAYEVAETYVNVRWRWFAFPVALQVLAWYFAYQVLFPTRWSRPKQRIWKSSALATLFHGLSPAMRKTFEPLPLLSSMDAVAKATNVALVSGDGGSWLRDDVAARNISSGSAIA